MRAVPERRELRAVDVEREESRSACWSAQSNRVQVDPGRTRRPRD